MNTWLNDETEIQIPSRVLRPVTDNKVSRPATPQKRIPPSTSYPSLPHGETNRASPSPSKKQSSVHNRAQSVPEFSTPPHLSQRDSPAYVDANGSPYSRGRVAGYGRRDPLDRFALGEIGQLNSQQRTGFGDRTRERGRELESTGNGNQGRGTPMIGSPLIGSPIIGTPRRSHGKTLSLTVSPVVPNAEIFEKQEILTDGSPSAVDSVELLMRKMAFQQQQIGELKESLAKAEISLSTLRGEWQVVLGSGPPEFDDSANIHSDAKRALSEVERFYATRNSFFKRFTLSIIRKWDFGDSVVSQMVRGTLRNRYNSGIGGID